MPQTGRYSDCDDPMNACFLLKPVQYAQERGIPVITMNNGESLLPLVNQWQHVGQQELLAGKLACRRLIEAGASHVLITDTEAGTHEAINARKNGCIEATDEAGLSHTVMYDFKTELDKTQQVLRELLTAGENVAASSLGADYETIDAVLGTSGYAVAAVTAVVADLAGTIQLTNNIGTFDVTAEAEECLAAGTCQFAVDQQEYLQGYLPVVYAAARLTSGNSVPEAVGEDGGRVPISTGPGFVTKDRLSKKSCQKAGLIFCEDSDVEPFGGRYPLSDATAECPCIDRLEQKICVVHHGRMGSSFWGVANNGIDIATADVKVPVTRMESELISNERQVEMIDECMQDGTAKALIVSMQDENLAEAARKYSEMGIPVFSMNAGEKLLEQSGVLLHVGQQDYLSGYLAAKTLHEGLEEGIAPVVACIDSGSDMLDSLNLRCQGAKNYLNDMGYQVPGEGDDEVEMWANSGLPKAYQIDVDSQRATVAIRDVMDGLDRLRDAYGLEVNIMIGSSSTSCAAIVELYYLEILGGCFDTGAVTLEGMKEDKIEFAIDQQQWLQGYLSVVHKNLFLITGGEMVKTSSGIFDTGPSFLKTDQIATKNCENERWSICDESLEPFDGEGGSTNTQLAIIAAAVSVALVLLLAGWNARKKNMQVQKIKEHEQELQNDKKSLALKVDVLETELKLLQKYDEKEKEMIDEQIKTFRQGMSRAKSVKRGLDDPSLMASFLIDPEDIKSEDVIGKGSFGEVFRATYRGRSVAVKVMKNVDREALNRFRGEIMLMHDMVHSNVCQMVGACWDRQLMALVMEFCANGSVEDLLRRDEAKAFSWDDPILKWCKDIARGMNYLHTVDYYDIGRDELVHGVLHRDMKPDNCLVADGYTVKIADFGEARAGVEDGTMTQVGTPMYIAPEIVRGDHYDQSVDVFGFAMTALRMGLSNMDIVKFLGEAMKAASLFSSSKSLEQVMMEKMLAGSSSATIPEKQVLPSRNKISHALISKGWRPTPKFMIEKGGIPKCMAGLITVCWSADPKERATFAEIVEYLDAEAR
ncbi:hypothetical protein TeGR_g4621 [Tetraparma gracilis]|uniref:Protein kinase domain-containing protein n=1 Tax=Tetraparma gracilis TaxID=2962635 RepID=A0ABQ6N279_9STRA|nr:hypothetical protein TeGR_g4621 [Tetraparma gracilis]